MGYRFFECVVPSVRTKPHGTREAETEIIMKAGNKIKKLVSTYQNIYLSLKKSENEALRTGAGNIALADLYINRYIYNEAIEKVEAFIKENQ